MIRLMLAGLVLTFAGCANYAERQAQPPTFEGQTKKAPDEFISCAAPKILPLWGAARVIPDGESRVIVVGDNSITGLTITAAPVNGVTRVTMRQPPSLRKWTSEWALAQSCL